MEIGSSCGTSNGEVVVLNGGTGGTSSGGGVSNGKEVVSNGENGGGGPADESGMQLLQRSLDEAQAILEHNRMMIREIAQNHETRMAGGLTRNVALIRELNSNIARLVQLYAKLSSCFDNSLILVENSAALAPATAGTGADQGFKRLCSSE